MRIFAKRLQLRPFTLDDLNICSPICAGEEVMRYIGSGVMDKQQTKENYQIIELRGGFEPEWVHKVTEALNNKVPVGGVSYGSRFRQQLADLFK